MAHVTLTKDNFVEEVLRSEQTVLVDFWASWCGPCMALAPTIDEIAGEQTVVKVGKVNVDDEPELAAAFHVSTVPSVALVKGGKVVSMVAGACPKEQLQQMVGSALPKK